MNTQSFSTCFLVDRSPEEVFGAINDVRGWWSGSIDGDTDKLGAEFRYRYDDLHDSTQKLTELIPGKKIVWRVTDSHLSFVEDQRGWKGTDIVFQIAKKGGRTEVHFTHDGLTPSCECYDACSQGWTAMVANLRERILTGEPQPDPFAAGA